MTEPDLVAVFQTDDHGLLPLATMALEAEGIEYTLRSPGKRDSLQWMMSQLPSGPAPVEIVVTSDVAARARELLVDLEQSAANPAALESQPLTDAEPPSILIENAITGAAIGHVTESQLLDLLGRFELEDDDVKAEILIDRNTMDRLEQDAGVDHAIVDLLRQALGPGEDALVIRWSVR